MPSIISFEAFLVYKVVVLKYKTHHDFDLTWLSLVSSGILSSTVLLLVRLLDKEKWDSFGLANFQGYLKAAEEEEEGEEGR